ncbi:unnamed protein product [Echinostoma caproni]|uniref:Zinc transporter n=1 Tax=Echinostoma caproni TaxID=27848 RepID=A0A183AWA2_9TREM|nr:unnamed protein product [Echinostoma caproni]
MSFSKDCEHTFNVCNTFRLQTVNQHKINGFWLSNSLSFSCHHQKARKKAFGILNFIKRSFYRFDKGDFQLLYDTYVRPLLEYGAQIACSGLLGDRNSLERVQRAATKLFSGLFRVPHTIRSTTLNIYPRNTRRIRADLFLLYHLLFTDAANQFFTPYSLDTLRGRSKKLFKPRPRTRVHHWFFTHRVTLLWNRLPQEIVDAPSKSMFKHKLDIFLGLQNAITNSHYNDHCVPNMCFHCGNTTRLVCMMCLVATYFLVELIVGYVIHSIALVADAFHMLSDFLALVVGVIAARIAKWPSSSKNTFGWQRAEVMGGLINTVVLITLCSTILMNAIQRFIEPEPINNPRLMVYVGAGGLAVNVLGLIVLGAHSHDNSNTTIEVVDEVIAHILDHGAPVRSQLLQNFPVWISSLSTKPPLMFRISDLS